MTRVFETASALQSVLPTVSVRLRCCRMLHGDAFFRADLQFG
jgi:hypothetical protein